MKDVWIAAAGFALGWLMSKTWQDPGCRFGLALFLIIDRHGPVFALAVVGHGRSRPRRPMMTARTRDWWAIMMRRTCVSWRRIAPACGRPCRRVRRGDRRSRRPRRVRAQRRGMPARARRWVQRGHRRRGHRRPRSGSPSGMTVRAAGQAVEVIAAAGEPWDLVAMTVEQGWAGLNAWRDTRARRRDADQASAPTARTSADRHRRARHGSPHR